MEFNLVAAIVAGLVGTAVMTAMMMAPRMGMPKMDIPGLPGSMFCAPGSRMIGRVMHFMMGERLMGRFGGEVGALEAGVN